jgi:hypothetical protein
MTEDDRDGVGPERSRNGTDACMGLATGESDSTAKEVMHCVCDAYCRSVSDLRGV